MDTTVVDTRTFKIKYMQMKSQAFFLMLTLAMVESLTFAQVTPSDSLQSTVPTDSLSDVIASQDTAARPSPDPTVVKPNWAYVKSYYVDTKAILKAPFHWKKPDFIKLAAYGYSSGFIFGGSANTRLVAGAQN